MLQSVGSRHVNRLLRLHSSLHHGVVRFQSVNVILRLGKHLGLDALAQAVLSRCVGKQRFGDGRDEKIGNCSEKFVRFSKYFTGKNGGDV